MLCCDGRCRKWCSVWVEYWDAAFCELWWQWECYLLPWWPDNKVTVAASCDKTQNYHRQISPSFACQRCSLGLGPSAFHFVFLVCQLSLRTFKKFNLQIKSKTKCFSERLTHKKKEKTQQSSLIVLILPECFEAKSYAPAAVSNHLSVIISDIIFTVKVVTLVVT